MSRALQKAIVYELFGLFLAVVICAVALAESLTAGYLTGPWIALVVPALIALYGFLTALAAGDSSRASPETNDGDDSGPDTPDDAAGDGKQSTVAPFTDPPY